MVRRRHDQQPKLKLAIWKSEGKLWFADKSGLEAAVGSSGRTALDINKRMGAGYSHLQEALQGKGLTIWEASHVEWGVIPDGGTWTDRIHNR
jgi:hypothetical protein